MSNYTTCEQCEGTGQYETKVWGQVEAFECADCQGRGTAPADAYEIKA